MPASNDSQRTVAVLAYHKIGEPLSNGWQTWNYVAEETFRSQLRVLRSEGWEVVDHATFLAGLDDPAVLPQRSALLTFDDGYRSMLVTATPILEALAMPAVCFVPTQYIGDCNVWDRDNEPDEPICDWGELRELGQRGVSIQSHSVSHPDFATLSLDRVLAEVRDSKRHLEEGLDAPVDSFAFPYGATGEDVAAVDGMLAEAGYRAGFVYKGGRFELPAAAPFRMTRIPVGPDTNLEKWLRGQR